MTVSEDEPPIPGGRDDRLLGWERVHDLVGISRSTAWRLQRAGDFPKPVSLSPGRVGWWESELTAWKQSRGAVGAPVRRPARVPNLPGLARPMPIPAAPPAPTLIPDRPAAALASSPRKPARRRAVSSQQIDFGF